MLQIAFILVNSTFFSMYQEVTQRPALLHRCLHYDSYDVQID